MNTQWSRFLIWLFGSWLLISGHAFGNSYTKGMKAFKDEDYSKAYKILSAVVKKSKDKTDKAEAMVLMGAAAAKMGKKSKAESLFNKALKLDSDASIPRDVVKDKGVRKLFAKAKKGGGGGDDDMGDDFGDEKMSSKSSGGGSSSSLTPYIPFGIGYLMDGQIGKGLLYGGAQVAGVVGFLYYNNEITKANKDADAIGQDALARQAAGQAVDQETLDFLDQNEAFVKAAQSNQTLMVAVAAGGYGLSVLDGLFFGGGSSSSKKSKKSRRRSDILPPTAGEKLADTAVEEVEEMPRLWNMKLHLVPRSDPGLMLSINRSF
ncbi:tetratricopeptide repeat protein [Oligoflexus tunisiensis]|uniref:tetratricopeptide repeat protein n=1 Tax=Oligoflexus tunisiensis TaxID=708132 RepID=UPI00114D0C75|nr:tetratricopeptide repeat protein [Oligoflexus tunisiensis]